MPGVVVYCFVDAVRSRALSAAQREVLELAVAGWSNAAIAERRACSPRTVANLLARAYKKLAVDSRADAAARWWSAA